jgi:hypothetical protein
MSFRIPRERDDPIVAPDAESPRDKEIRGNPKIERSVVPYVRPYKTWAWHPRIRSLSTDTLE